MAKFQALVPDAPERFFAIVESQTIAPSKRLDQLVAAQINEAVRGRQSAVALMVLCVGCAIVFFAVGNTVAGLAFLGLPVLGFLRELLPERGSKQIHHRREEAKEPEPDSGDS
ncbi:hypothetical protein [Paenarthrobacter sp. C1]|uniref:hypothetical protein n=1 Tax=Paenarthrobacter sp. C1 TaxID=3400220 RepID=UPI003BF50F97